MHIHTAYSKDAGLKLKNLFRFCSARGIVPAITDHNTTKAWKEAEKLSKRYKTPFIKGEEIKVLHNECIVGELLGLFMNEPVKSYDVYEAIDELRAQDAIISVAHPFDIFRRAFKMLDEVAGKVDCIEIFNSRCWLSEFNAKAAKYARERKIPFTAGTDAHFSFELGKAFLICDASSLEEARKKILKGKCSYYGRLNVLSGHLMTWLRKLGVV